MRTLHISKEAYATIVLHSYKYPHSSVNGILVGKLSSSSSSSSSTIKEGEPSSSTNTSKRDFIITHAFPLFHAQLNLAPMTEFALHQIHSYCKQHQLSIVGYYQAHEFIDNNSIGPLGTIIGDKLRLSFNDAVVLIVNNRGLTHQDPSKLALNLYSNSNNNWRLETEDSNEIRLLPEDKNVISFTTKHTTEKTFRSLIDFQEHLEDVSKDWHNSSLFV